VSLVLFSTLASRVLCRSIDVVLDEKLMVIIIWVKGAYCYPECENWTAFIYSFNFTEAASAIFTGMDLQLYLF